MLRDRRIACLVIISLISHLSLLTLSAQDSLLLRDYQFVKRSDAWLTSQNAAGLTQFSTLNSHLSPLTSHLSISKAELSLTKSKGGLVDWYQSPDVLQATATVESFTRISQRAVVFGAMTYDNFSGHDMAGSAFFSPYSSSPYSSSPYSFSPYSSSPYSFPPHNPFDIVEDSLVNTGTKHRDTYQLTGAVGVDVWRGLAAGIRLDYTAANYAKYKDLRHKSKLMDMTFTAGINYPLSIVNSQFTIGANYLYRRTTESLVFSLYGREDKVYKSLIDYGAFMGRVEQFGSSGYTDKGQEMPLVDDYNGLGLQLSIVHYPLSIFTSMTYASRNGYYGRKSPYTITYTNHHADLLTFDARLSWAVGGDLQSPTSIFSADLTLSSENLENEANTYRELANESGAYYYEYYDPVKTANKLWKNGQFALTADLGINGELPAWTLMASLDWYNRQQTSYLYPYYRRQHLHNTKATLSATRNLLTPKGVWTFSMTASYQKGSGEPYTDLTFAEPSVKQSTPATMDAWLWREYQYIVAPQYSVGGSVAYAFVFPQTKLKTHVRLSATHRKANQTYEYSNGKDCTSLTLAVGCTF